MAEKYILRPTKFRGINNIFPVSIFPPSRSSYHMISYSTTNDPTISYWYLKGVLTPKIDNL